MKKAILILLIIGFGGYWILPKPNPNLYSEKCAFCDSEVIERQKFYEDEWVVALYTHRPIFPGHFLIVPKRHVERFDLLLADESVAMQRAVQKVHEIAKERFGIEPYLLLQKNGYEVGQSVPHVHLHYIGRKPGEDSQVKFFARLIWSSIERAMSHSQMESMVQSLRAADPERNPVVQAF